MKPLSISLTLGYKLSYKLFQVKSCCQVFLNDMELSKIKKNRNGKKLGK